MFIPKRKEVAIIGCGHHAFSTIAFFLLASARRGIGNCFDTDRDAAQSFARFFRAPNVSVDSESLLRSADIGVVYIASNHASHADYAVAALQAGRIVFVEKPIAVTMQQLCDLAKTVRKTSGTIYAGYNRPFSSAVRSLKRYCDDASGPLTLSCFVSGHDIAPDHWYREQREGTRVCGNLGHWLDLAVHILSWQDLPDRWRIQISYGDSETRDDNLVVSLCSTRGDLINILLTSRSEPFEGINETIGLQWGECIAKIDDFRRMTVWKGPDLSTFKYSPKDVGHKRAVLQPFATSNPPRSWHEIELSSLLMLKVKDMVVAGEGQSEFEFSQAWEALGVPVD